MHLKLKEKMMFKCVKIKCSAEMNYISKGKFSVGYLGKIFISSV